jgi:hypothetical protein
MKRTNSIAFRHIAAFLLFHPTDLNGVIKIRL